MRPGRIAAIVRSVSREAAEGKHGADGGNVSQGTSWSY